MSFKNCSEGAQTPVCRHLFSFFIQIQFPLPWNVNRQQTLHTDLNALSLWAKKCRCCLCSSLWDSILRCSSSERCWGRVRQLSTWVRSIAFRLWNILRWNRHELCLSRLMGDEYQSSRWVFSHPYPSRVFEIPMLFLFVRPSVSVSNVNLHPGHRSTSLYQTPPGDECTHIFNEFKPDMCPSSNPISSPSIEQMVVSSLDFIFIRMWFHFSMGLALPPVHKFEMLCALFCENRRRFLPVSFFVCW